MNTKWISKALLVLIPIVIIMAWIIFYLIQDKVHIVEGYLNLLLLTITGFLVITAAVQMLHQFSLHESHFAIRSVRHSCEKTQQNLFLRIDIFFELYTDRLVSVSLAKIELRTHLTTDAINEQIIYACRADNVLLAGPGASAGIKAQDEFKLIEIHPQQQVLISVSKPVFVHIDMAGVGLDNITRLDLAVTSSDGKKDVYENIHFKWPA